MKEKTPIGINGFGRIGRISFRASFLPSSTVKVTHINDPFMSLADMAALVNFDSAHGRWVFRAEPTESGLTVFATESCPCQSCDCGTPASVVKVTHEKQPSEIPWEVAAVVDCTGVFLTQESAQQHLSPHSKQSKATRVVLSAPPKDAAVPMHVIGVNHAAATASVVSNASCTTNCLAPLTKVLSDRFGISSGLMTTVHAVTANQPAVDGPNKRSLRMGFSGFANIVPASTGAAKAVGAVLPSVKGRLTGMAFRVPTVDVSVVDVTFVLKDKTATLATVLDALREAASSSLRGVLRVDDSGVLTSAAIKGEECSSVIDAGVCMEMEGEDGERLIKIVSWYDNEFGYSCRLLQLAGHMAALK